MSKNMEFSASNLSQLEKQLDHFDPKVRKSSLKELIAKSNSGDMIIPDGEETANLHCHSFFSYNGYGYSPTHLAWKAKKNGIKFMGVVDFDVLDGVDEFLDACELAGVRGTAGIETRVFLPEFAFREINSPGEPGVLYHMGTGFVSAAVPDEAAEILKEIKARAAARNREMLKRINTLLNPLCIDYETDVLPLTPAGTATERHMVKVIADKANRSIADSGAYWSDKLRMDESEVKKYLPDENRFTNLLRAKLMKHGSVGYVQPTSASFPAIDEFHRIMQLSGAFPCSAWLDGMSEGEQAIEELLELLIDKGTAAINIVPERNWNFADKEIKIRKLFELERIVKLANQLDLPVLVGTEMNKFGQKLVDDFAAPELAFVRDTFVKGAYFLFGHTQLERYWGIGYNSLWAKKQFQDRKAKNSFYEKAGHTIRPGVKSFSTEFNQKTPDQVLNRLLEL